MNIPPLIAPLMNHGEVCRALGARARKRREQLKLSRRELSARSSVSAPTISRFETSGVATIAVMVKLARALDSLDTLEGLFAASRYRSMAEFIKAES